MKSFKIILIVVVVSAIAFFIIRSLVLIDRTRSIPLPKNQFTERIRKEIDSIGRFPENKFCKDDYNNINYLINDYYKPNPPKYPYGRLGNTQTENDQWKTNLESNLYSTYAEKFINQSFYVFRGSEWKLEDIRFIRSEYQSLRTSSLLQRGSPVDKKFTEIQTILSKYDEIISFISVCMGFSYSSSSLSDHFPIEVVKVKISQAKGYLNNHSENDYVNHCNRLQDGIKNIPQVLFRVHVRYIDDKISQWSGLYSNYNSHRDYVNNLYQPLKSEIETLNDETYHVANLDSEQKRLSNRWSVDNTNAYKYFTH